MSDPDELQLQEDEGRPVTKKRRRNVKNCNEVGGYRMGAQGWKKKEDELRCQVNNTARGSKRKRLDGGGRHVSYPEIDVALAEWVRIKHGSGDDKITCFKPERSIGGKGLTILNDIRAQQKSADGRNDFEEDGLEERELADDKEPKLTTLEDFNDEEYFMFVEQFI
uniref:Uncharacterized protein n=1 Tax=Ditylenchus dipsaci TaxID=166011 RepID=A0A915DYC3_9BILA